MPTDPTPERAAGSVDPKLLEILVCPLTKGPLEYDAAAQELITREKVELVTGVVFSPNAMSIAPLATIASSARSASNPRRPFM